MTERTHFMLKFLAQWCIATTLTLVLNSCADATPTTPYSHNGFSVTTTNNWAFVKDSNESLFGEREVIFSLGELSFAAFYIQEKSSDFSSFVNFYLKKTQPSTSDPDTKIEQENKKFSKYNTVITTIQAQFLGSEETTILYSIDIPSTDKNIYFMSLITPSDSVAITDELEDIIDSLKLEI